jgi:ADP-heptose:LPS heptosyltransferase
VTARAVVLRALGLGDFLAAVPALRGLRVSLPVHHIVLAGPAWLAPVALEAGLVDEVVNTTTLATLPVELHGADIAVNLHGRGPTSTALLRQSVPVELMAFDVPGGPAWTEGEHERMRWCRLLRHHGLSADPDDLRLQPPSLIVPSAFEGVTIVHPGAASAARRWPADRWAAVAAAEVASGRRVIVTGAVHERPLAEAVARGAGLGTDAVLAGRTDLRALLALVGAADRVICGDTGVAHVATATGTPSVVLFGPVSPEEWGPPPWGPHLALWHGRRGDPHGDRLDPGLLAISVDEVLQALVELDQRLAAKS